MTTYAIGDIQGCFAALEKLLVKLNFDSKQDTLWFTGDLVNRGPQSLEVLRYVKALDTKHKIVLGNHDLNLLAVVYGNRQLHHSDTLDAILQAPDREELLTWLRQQPLLIYDEKLNCVMSHAGIAPNWDVSKAKSLAREVETVLRSDGFKEFLLNMYGNQPDYWQDNLTGMDRLRCITNFLTRMRFCHADGRLDLEYKGTIAKKPKHLVPWFLVKDRVNSDTNIIFGHWAALGGKTNTPNVFALDTGCVWGNCLTAMRLEDGAIINVKC